MDDHEVTAEEIQEWKDRIDKMSHADLAALYRFARPGHPVFRSGLPLYNYFNARFQSLGGMTPEVSRKIGW